MEVWTSWIFKHDGYLDMMDLWISWIFGYHLGEHEFYVQPNFKEDDTFEALSMQSCIA